MVNIADTLDEYKGKLRTAGFASSQFFDTTALSSKRMHDALHIDLRTKMLAQNLSTELFDNVLVRLPWASRSISHYIVGNARKGQPS
jgi:hypothetical protein